MRIPRDCQILKACASLDDTGRMSIWGAYLDVAEKTLTATNGKILVVVNVEIDDGDVSGIVPQEAIKEAFKLAKSGPLKGLPPTLLVGADAVTLLDKRTFPVVKMTYPNWRQVLPKLDNARQRVARLWINTELLAALALAANASDGVVLLEFELDNENDCAPKPIRVTVGSSRDVAHAVIMPLRLKSRAPDRVDDVGKAHELAAMTADMIAAGADANAIDAAVLAPMRALADCLEEAHREAIKDARRVLRGVAGK